MFVIDASALIDAADVNRPEWAVALDAARRQSGLQAPALLASEAGHVIHRKRPQRFGATPAARSAVLELLLAQADLVPSDDAHRAAAAGVAEFGLTFYDAEYVALAHRTGADLVTHDRDMAAVAGKMLGPKRVLTLDDLRARQRRTSAA